VDKFIEGLTLIFKKNPNVDYSFDHDIMYIGNLEDFDAFELNELCDLGFYIDSESDCLITFS